MMNFKTISAILLLPLACGLAVAQAVAMEDVAVWKAEKVQSGDGAMTWTDEKQAYDLELADAQGVSVGEKPGAGEDGKSVVFSGAQRKAFATRTPFPEFNGNLEVRLALNPGNSTAGTVIRCNRQWQIGLKQFGQDVCVELLLWLESGGLASVRVKVQPETWQEVTASVIDNVARISCNGVEDSKQLNETLRSPDGGNFLYIGLPVPSASAQSTEGGAPFQGAIADVRVSM